MTDQSFSAENFEKIFNIENRKGNITKDMLPETYITTIKDIKNEKQELQKKIQEYQKEEITKEELNDFRSRTRDKINLLKKKKENILYDELKCISKNVNNSKFKFEFCSSEHKGKATYLLGDDLPQYYAMKQLQYNIKRTFKVKQSDRYRIVKQIKILLADAFPKIIIRTDIKSFFENIPQDILLKKINNSTLLNYQSKKFIKNIIDEYESLKNQELPSGVGIPRGIGISAYLSELYMHDIDNRIKAMNNVTFYARYVDDIFIIISPIHGNLADSYMSEITKILEEYKLHLNESKTIAYDLLRNNDVMETYSFSYLGYIFDIRLSKSIYSMTVGLSVDKMKRYMQRLEYSFDDYNKESKYNEKKARKILFNRIRFLTGNTKLLTSKKGIKVGIYYSNSLLDDTWFRTKFGALDGYLKKMIHTNLHPYCTESFNLNKLKTRLENSFNFTDGFKNKRFHNFTIDEFYLIRKIWDDEE